MRRTNKLVLLIAVVIALLAILAAASELGLLNDNAQIVSSEIANVGKRKSIQTHSRISIPEIDFEMFSVVFLEDGFVYIFELRTVSDIVSKFMEIVRTFEIIE